MSLVYSSVHKPPKVAFVVQLNFFFSKSDMIDPKRLERGLIQSQQRAGGWSSSYHTHYSWELGDWAAQRGPVLNKPLQLFLDLSFLVKDSRWVHTIVMGDYKSPEQPKLNLLLWMLHFLSKVEQFQFSRHNFFTTLKLI